MKSINNLKPSQRGVIINIALPEQMKRRMFDLGLIEGTEIECTASAVLGEPKAYLIRGSVFAIRKEEGKKIFIREVS